MSLIKILLVVTILLLSLAGLYCLHRFRSPYVEIPNSQDSALVFSPAGRYALILRASSPAHFLLFDVDSKREIWRLPGHAQKGAAFSPAGSLLLLAHRDPGSRATSLMVVRTLEGVPVFKTDLTPTVDYNPDAYVLGTANLFSLSDDGRWLALGLDDDSLEIRSLPEGRIAYVKREPGRIRSATFEPGKPRLAVCRTDRGTQVSRVRLTEYRGGEWVDGALLAGAWPAWISGGLGLQTDQGLTTYVDGGEGLSLSVRGWAGRQSKGSDVARSLLVFSPDGAFAVADAGDSMQLMSLREGSTLLSYPVAEGPGFAILSAAFAGSVLRVFLGSGLLLKIDLAKGEVLSRESFGRTGWSAESWFHEGATWRPAYQPALSPDGKYLSLYRPDRGFSIYLTE